MERIPILRMGDLLIVTIQVDMHDRLAMTLQDDLTREIIASNAQGVLINISSLDMIDSFIGRMLSNISSMSSILAAQTVKIVTAVSELARNTLVHGKGGFMLLEALKNEDLRKGIRVVFEDKGPGIQNIEEAMQDGFSTGQSLGLGLGGAKRLSNEFEIISRPGEGTRVTIARWS